MTVATLARRELVLLDAGGTLITLDYERVRTVLAPGGGAPSDGQLDRAEAVARRWANAGVRERLSWRELWDLYFERLLIEAGLAAASIPASVEALWRTNRESGLWCRPVPEARGVLKRLRRAGKRLAVVSNAEGQVQRDLELAGLADLLETVVDSYHVGVSKPDPRIFEIALDRLGARADDAVYVGDVPAFDVDGAAAAGIPAVLLDPHDIHGDARAVRIRSLAELPALLGA